MQPLNLFGDIPADLSEEWSESLLQTTGLRLERIVSRGHSSPDEFWYQQEENEWVALLRGQARLAYDDGSPEMPLGPGDHLLIPAGKRHRVAWTDPENETVWLAIFFRAV